MTAPPTEPPAGTGDAEALGKLLTSLADGRATGVLSLKYGEVVRKIHLYEGLCCSFQSEHRDDQLGQVMVRVGWFTSELLKKITARTGRANPSTGEMTLVIKPQDLPEGRTLRDALRLHLQLVGAATFAWPTFEYKFDPFPSDVPTSAGLEVDPMGLVTEGLSSSAPDEAIAQILAELGDVAVIVTQSADRFADVLTEFFGEDLLRHIASEPRRPSEIVAGWPDPNLAKRAVAALFVAGCIEPVVTVVDAAVKEVPPPLVPAASSAAPPPPRSSGQMPAYQPSPPAPAASPPPPIQDWDVTELRNLLSMSYFELLTVPQDVGADAVKEIVKRLVPKYDPRSAAPEKPEVKDLLTKVTSRLREAQITLLHPEVRKQYIQSLGASPGRGPTTLRNLKAVSTAPAQSPARQAADAAQAEAKTMEQMGQWDRAREAMARAIDAAPKESDFHARMGWYTYKNAEMPSAERERLWKYHLEYALELNPNELLARHYLGAIYANQGNLGRARLELAAALKIDPSFKPSRDGLDRLGKPSKAEERQAAMAQYGPLGRRKPKNKVAGLVVGLFFASIPLAISLVMGDPDRVLEFSATDLGATVELWSARREQKMLLLQFEAESWDKLSANDQESELLRIGKNAETLGMTEIIAFLNTGDMVGQYAKGKAEVIPHVRR